MSKRLPFRIFATSLPGLEGVLGEEVARLPSASRVQVLPEGVALEGDLSTLYSANLWLRTASRVLVRLGEGRARDFAHLYRLAASLPWSRVAAPRVRLEIAATARKSRLYHTGAIAERVRDAVGRAVVITDAPDAPLMYVIVRGERDLFQFSVDSSGELLHRRGYREETAKAPLRETLAAGILALARWDPSTPLFDPTCGSGTLILEGALMASGIAPGLMRTFAFAHWPGFDQALWERLVAEARAKIHPPGASLVGADRHPSAVGIARRNAERAGLSDTARFLQADVRQAHVPEGPPGLIACNPPFGKRVSPPSGLRSVYSALGSLLQRAPGWRLAVLASDPSLAREIKANSVAEVPLTTGGLKVRLYVMENRQK
ncbi:MAG: class I SAM-dependent RNA methyltransferase [Deltaproteobacteria bacterium]|nr:class I SAM-dependent RNA methyltransferase [Deltaproteobacteria bacterium]